MAKDTEQRYRVTGANRNTEVVSTGGKYRITGPTGLDFFYVAQERREKGKRKWILTESYYLHANGGRVVSGTCYPAVGEPYALDVNSDKGAALAAEIARFYADTTGNTDQPLIDTNGNRVGTSSSN